VRFAVRLTPKGGRDTIEGRVRDTGGADRLKARVAAVSESGKANAALISLLSKTLTIAKSRIAIASGESARMKTVQIAGVALAAALEALGDKA
jgi:uncharacterized protein